MILKIISIFLFWRLGLLLVTYLAAQIFPVASNGGLGAPTITKPFDYWLSWAQWDGGHFYNVAKSGYLLTTDYAFFPLYPWFVKFSTVIFLGNTLLSGLLISNLSFLLFLVIFFKFTQKMYQSDVAYNSLITFLAFPTTFFAAAFYSEGLFLLLTILTFWLLYEKRVLLAAVAASFAATARLVGAALIISLFYNYFATVSFRIKNISSKILIPFVSAFGVSIYSVYLFYTTNDPFKFASAQAIWQRGASDPLSTIAAHFWGILTNPKIPTDKYLDFMAPVVFLAILIIGTRKIPSSLWIFSILVILIPASSGTLTSMPRYVLSSLGTFIIIGQFLKNRPKFRLILWGFLLTLQAILASRFINGYWVA